METSAGLGDALAQLLATVRPRASEFAARQVAQIRAGVPVGSVPDDDWLWEAIGRSYAANVGLALDLVAAGATELPDELPPESVELARAVARAGLPPDTIGAVFRTGQSRLWDGWRALVEELDLDPATTLAVLDEVMRFGTRYMAWSAHEVASRYRRELESRADTLLALVRQVLDGRAAQDVQLGYSLHGSHLAVVVTGARAREATVALAGVLGQRPLLVAPEPETAWAWLSGQPDPDGRSRRRLEALAATEGVTVGLGSVRTTIQGFRRSHEDARIACRCAQASGAPLAAYPDVLPEALALGDANAAVELVARTLGPLGADRRGERLRETLRAYCATGNGASTASLLSVSRRTIAYRLAEIERRLGAPIASRRTEIDLALRIEALVAAQPSSS